jgi:hypothetical protein
VLKYSVEDLQNFVDGKVEYPEINRELVVDLMATLTHLIETDPGSALAITKKLPKAFTDISSQNLRYRKFIEEIDAAGGNTDFTDKVRNLTE